MLLGAGRLVTHLGGEQLGGGGLIDTRGGPCPIADLEVVWHRGVMQLC